MKLLAKDILALGNVDTKGRNLENREVIVGGIVVRGEDHIINVPEGATLEVRIGNERQEITLPLSAPEEAVTRLREKKKEVYLKVEKIKADRLVELNERAAAEGRPPHGERMQ